MAHPSTQGFKEVRSRWEENRREEEAEESPGVALVLPVECPGVKEFIWQKLEEPGPAWQCLAWIRSGRSEKPCWFCQF